jgi:methylphosphotriester-DNA--protein-cysteine methyltransferase
MYALLGPDGRACASESPGTLGGNSRLRIYGRLDCWSARRALGKGYEKIRVFFADEPTAIAAGYRPCGHCMRAEYRGWKAAQAQRT